MSSSPLASGGYRKCGKLEVLNFNIDNAVVWAEPGCPKGFGCIP
jgi:hypothetical protein